MSTSDGNSSMLNANQPIVHKSPQLNHMDAQTMYTFHGVSYKQTFLTIISCHRIQICALALSYSFLYTILIRIFHVCISTNTYTEINLLSVHFLCKFNPVEPTPVRSRWVTYLYAALGQSAMKAFPFVINCSLSEEQS